MTSADRAAADRRVVIEFLIFIVIVCTVLVTLILTLATDKPSAPTPMFTEVAHVDQSG